MHSAFGIILKFALIVLFPILDAGLVPPAVDSSPAATPADELVNFVKTSGRVSSFERYSKYLCTPKQ